MFKTFATNVVISKGYEGAEALRFSEKGESVRFRIGQKVYDNRVERNYRWLNIAAKAFGTVCDRIKKMKLKEGSFVNLTARLDEEKWIDKETKEEKSQHVLIVEDIEYAFVGKSSENQSSGQNHSQEQSQPTGQPQQAEPEAPVEPASVNLGQAPAVNQAAAQQESEPQSVNPMDLNGFMGFEAYQGNNLFTV